MTQDQYRMDRERIAEAMNKATHKVGQLWYADNFYMLGDAIRAFEVLCWTKGWGWNRHSGIEDLSSWTAFTMFEHDDPRYNPNAIAMVEGTGNHAADVCRLVCLVLDREGANAVGN